MSFELADYTAEVDALGTLRILDAIKTCNMEKTVRFYQVKIIKLSKCKPFCVFIMRIELESISVFKIYFVFCIFCISVYAHSIEKLISN